MARVARRVVTLAGASGLLALSAMAFAATGAAAELGPVTATTVTLTLSATSGPAYQSVTLAGVVAGVTIEGATDDGATDDSATSFDDGVVPTGSCTFANDSAAGRVVLATVRVEADGTCAFTSTALGAGTYRVTVDYVPEGDFAPSVSAVVDAEYEGYDCLTGDRCEDPGTVLPPIPRGTLSIITPYTPANPFDLGTLLLAPDGTSYRGSAPFGAVDDPAAGITIVDTRNGGLAFTAQVAATDFVNGDATIAGTLLGFTDVAPGYIPGNGVNARSNPVTVSDVTSVGRVARTFATGSGPGSVFVRGTMSLTDVPTSTPPGRYVATVTFTIS